jgi:hypothetical protein
MFMHAKSVIMGEVGTVKVGLCVKSACLKVGVRMATEAKAGVFNFCKE